MEIHITVLYTVNLTYEEKYVLKFVSTSMLLSPIGYDVYHKIIIKFIQFNLKSNYAKHYLSYHLKFCFFFSQLLSIK